MEKLVNILVGTLCLYGCSTSSGVLKAGPDTYSINVLANIYPGGVAAAKRAAYEEGQQECAKSGKEFLVVNEQITPRAIDLKLKQLFRKA